MSNEQTTIANELYEKYSNENYTMNDAEWDAFENAVDYNGGRIYKFEDGSQLRFTKNRVY